MEKRKEKGFIICCILLFTFVNAAQSSNPVEIEFFYWDPTLDPGMCWHCPSWLSALEDYQNKSKILDNIAAFYGDKVLIYRIDYESSEYDFHVPRNSFVINREYLLKGEFTEDDVKQIIDAYLAETQPLEPLPSPSLIPILALAFTFGFFETFSPCLIILLAFVLSYTMGENSQFWKRFLQVMAFATGFVASTMLVFSLLVMGLVVLSLMLDIQHVLMWTVSFFAILFGLDLLGFNVLRIFKKVDTKPVLQKVTRKHAYSYVGLVAIGFLFYFLDPCIAPVFAAMMSTFSPAVLFEFLPLVLSVFCLGVLCPFICIGIVAGSISKLVRGIYRHRSKIRAVSGLILIGYASYIVISLVA